VAQGAAQGTARNIVPPFEGCREESREGLLSVSEAHGTAQLANQRWRNAVTEIVASGRPRDCRRFHKPLA